MLEWLRNSNVTKTPIPDGITPKILKLTSFSTCKPLVEFFNKSLELKCLPNIWKQTNVTTVYKVKYSPDLVKNVDKGKYVRIIFCDISKAFDKV